MISEEQLSTWKRIANDATEGPWYNAEGSIVNDDFPIHRPALAHYTCLEDAEFICAAREAVPALIAEVRELQHRLDQAASHAEDCCAEVAKLEKQVDFLTRWLSNEMLCSEGEFGDDCDGDPDTDKCQKCWRDVARKAVEQ